MALLKADFGVEIIYEISGGSDEMKFLRRQRSQTRHEALISGINELIAMGAEQNFVPVIKTASVVRV